MAHSDFGTARVMSPLVPISFREVSAALRLELSNGISNRLGEDYIYPQYKKEQNI